MPRMLKIGIVCYPTIGGSGIVATELGMLFAEAGHEVHFISYERPVRLMNCRPNLHFHPVIVNEYSLFKYPDYTLPLSVRILDVSRDHDLDIIHVHYAVPHATAALLARLMLAENCRPALITTLHGTDTNLIGSDPHYQPIVKFSIDHSDGVTTVSESLKRQTIEVFDIQGPIEVIPNFVEVIAPDKSRDQTRAEIGASNDEIVLLHMSNLRPGKRVGDILAAVARCRSRHRVRLLILAGGDFTSFTDEAAKLGIADRVIALEDVLEIQNYIHASDIGIYASEEESFGLGILETLACGKPVIATRIGGIPEVVVDGVTGLLVPCHDIAALADAIDALVDDAERRTRLGSAGRMDAAARFSASRVRDHYLEFYRRFLPSEADRERVILNDVHSRLNATTVRRIARPQTTSDLTSIVLGARASGLKISVAGGRHAMGGQQFASGSIHIDMTTMDAVLGGDAERGLLHIQAGAMWPAIIEACHRLGNDWGIRQKQTGVDDVTLGGSISANAHGRGLLMGPICDDIEDLTLMDAEGRIVYCNRDENAELFSLVIGGYGLFGIIYSATLRLAPRQRLKRLVDIIDLDDAMNAVFRRTADGCLYGDFQFVIDTHDDGFLRRGVFSCYKPVESSGNDTAGDADMSPDAWLKLLKLAHDDKGMAFRLYAEHYLSTDGNCYWSDTMQLSTYIPSYADFLEKTRAGKSGQGVSETLVIGEHYVPRDQLLEFMAAARQIFRSYGTEVIYGTIRAIQRDRTTYLPWAGDDFVCVIFNLRTPHTDDGRTKTADTFRALVDASNLLDGSFFLTYHRHASAEQVEFCYPRFREWLGMKLKHDPTEQFTSDWYEHYRDAFAAR